MLDIGKETTQPRPKCYFTSTTLPAYLDPTQQPTKKPPYNTLYSQPYYHTCTLLSPASSSLMAPDPRIKYAKLNLPLLDLLTGDFFNKKIKTGNIVMLSAPLKMDTTSSTAEFKLVEGVLTILCDRATYERAGLTGTAILDPHARKHGASKFRIEVNLRLPSMLKGKKGFERLLRAAETVFTGPITWLFYDCNAAGVEENNKTLGESVDISEVAAQTEEMEAMMVPSFPGSVDKGDEDVVTDLLEWLSLAAISSPRIKQGDLVDEIISRYSIPTISTSTSSSDLPTQSPQNLTKTTWQGFLPNSFVADVFAKAVVGSRKRWFAILVQGFEEGRSFVILKTEDNRALTWDVEG